MNGRMTGILGLTLVGAALCHLSGRPAHPVGEGAPVRRPAQGYGQLPLAFEPNQGQMDPRVQFLTRGSGYALMLTGDEAVLSLAPSKRGGKAGTLRMRFPGASRVARGAAESPLPGRVNYFRGHTRREWRTDIPTYRRVRYADVYPGIDVVYYGKQRQVEYDFVVEPGRDPGAIRLAFGGETEDPLPVKIDANGDLALRTAEGTVRQLRPVIYQEIAGRRQPVDGRYVQRPNHEIGFEVAAYDATKPLVIDPVLVYSTYLGGSGLDSGHDVAAYNQGNAFVTGFTQSPTFGGQPVDALGDAFVTKINPAGTAVVYTAIIGGQGQDTGNGIAVDSTERAYVGGTTFSEDFPLVNPFQDELSSLGSGNPTSDAFVAVLNQAGNSLIYSTYYGETDTEEGNGIDVDQNGNAYLVGTSSSFGLPVPNAAQDDNAGGSDAFVARFNPNLSTTSTLVYASYLGGAGGDRGLGIAVRGTSAFITGDTRSLDFNITPNVIGSFDPDTSGDDAFVARFDTAQSGAVSLLYSTYLGGGGTDIGYGIGVDAFDNAYVGGLTQSPNFPTANAFSLDPGDGTVDDGFVTKLNPTATQLVYSTYLGGTAIDDVFALDVDANTGSAWVTGFTFSTNYPQVDPVPGVTRGDGDAFVTQLAANGASLVFSTVLGGGMPDTGLGIDVDLQGAVYVTGETTSPNFRTENPLQPTSAGGTDAWVAKFATQTIVPVTVRFGCLKFLKRQELYSLPVQLFNRTGQPIPGPVTLVLTNLPQGVELENGSGDISGSPTILVPVGPDNVLTPREAVTIQLLFASATKRKNIRFTPVVLSGSGGGA